MKTNETKAFVSEWTPCSREWFADLATYRAATGETPITEAILASDTGDSSLMIFNLANQCRMFERERGKLTKVSVDKKQSTE